MTERGQWLKECPACEGRGWFREDVQMDVDRFEPVVRDCWRCSGEGAVVEPAVEFVQRVTEGASADVLREALACCLARTEFEAGEVCVQERQTIEGVIAAGVSRQ